MNRIDTAPLAARMRPQAFDEFYGQQHLVGGEAAFRKAAESGRLGSFILWGPPGVGKTTLAEIVSSHAHAHFERVSAVSAGVADLRRIIDVARSRLSPTPQAAGLFEAGESKESGRTTLFIDEIHRFNRAQQDAILPYVEDGTVTLIGATTENPSFEVNAAVLSRCRVFVLHALRDDDIRMVLRRALTDAERGVGAQAVQIDEEAESALVGLANGDARTVLNMLELCIAVAESEGSQSEGSVAISLTLVESAVQRRLLLYDKSGDQHFDLISALHKSVRGSDPDASVYWLVRMLESGEDPMYLARRIVRMSVEDIGLADPKALEICMAAQAATHFIGMPEAGVALAEAVIYLAVAQKSNAAYEAYEAARADVAETRNDPVPVHLRNAPTKLMKDLGYGQGYKYAHDFPEALIAQTNLPESLSGKTYYRPTSRGAELKISERIENIRAAWASAPDSLDTE